MRATSLLVVLFLISGSISAQTEDSTQEFEREVKPFLQKYCADCHSGDDPEGSVTLVFEQAPDIANQFEKWTAVLQKVGGQEMPPEDAELHPNDQERAAFASWVNAGLSNLDCSLVKVKPRTTVRRLNRAEYNNVIRDLFGLDLHPADEFPADDVGEGFDNLGEVLSLPPLLMEKYLDGAELVTKTLSANPEAWERVFPKLSETVKEFEDNALRESIRRLATKAFRRPLVDDELLRLLDLYQLARARDISSVESLAFATQAILVSPQFLFRLEEDPTAADADEPKPLDDYAIASRLSFFLWSTIPDETLNQLAEQGKLQDAETVAHQARRMLKDSKAKALVDNFAGQWLGLRLLSGLAPDPDLFPTFDDSLRAAMVEETKRYFAELVINDGSVLDLIDSDYTFLNERLAKHYGIDQVQGEEFQKVKLQDDRRGGILTHASILTLTSNPTRTSPVKRGKWILDNILGTPPPPPPPNVPELEEGDDLLGSLRERMQQHRENPSCAVCHRKMDALGFGFENFDAIGAWRDQDGRYEIDPSGELPGGLAFRKPAELRRILIDNSGEFTGCLTSKLLTYALGRALSLRDQCLVDDIVEHVQEHDHRFSELVVAIATSDAFRFAGYQTDNTGATQ